MATILRFDARRRPRHTTAPGSPFQRGVYQHPYCKRLRHLQEHYQLFIDELKELSGPFEDSIERRFIENDPLAVSTVFALRSQIQEFIAEQRSEGGARTPYDEAVIRHSIGSPWNDEELVQVAHDLPLMPEYEQLIAFAWYNVPRMYAQKAIETGAASALERGCILAFYETEPSLKIPRRVWRRSWSAMRRRRQ